MPKLEQAYHSAGLGYVLAAVALLIAVGAAMWLVLWYFNLMIRFGAPFGWAASGDDAGDRILPRSTRSGARPTPLRFRLRSTAPGERLGN
jgi:hypothetical protein